MSSNDLVAQLREAFDVTFARPSSVQGEALEGFLGIRLGEHPYALRLTEISALVTGKPVTALPSPLPDLLGLAGFRGNLVAVYSLTSLLGHPAVKRTETRPRCLVLHVSGRVAFAFEQLDGHLRAPATSIVAETSQKHINGLLTGETRAIISLGSVLRTIEEQVASAHGS